MNKKPRETALEAVAAVKASNLCELSKMACFEVIVYDLTDSRLFTKTKQKGSFLKAWAISWKGQEFKNGDS